MSDQKKPTVEKQNDEQVHGPRGGNSGRSVPPGVDLDAGYANDDWALDPNQRPENERD